MHCCLRGYSAGLEETCSRLTQTKINRLKCVKILIRNGADINFQNDYVKMTALHWAAYNDDLEVTKLLL